MNQDLLELHNVIEFDILNTSQFFNIIINFFHLYPVENANTMQCQNYDLKIELATLVI